MDLFATLVDYGGVGVLAVASLLGLSWMGRRYIAYLERLIERMQRSEERNTEAIEGLTQALVRADQYQHHRHGEVMVALDSLGARRRA